MHVLILDNIRSAENVGSLFRTADAVGISKIFLSGITPAPVDRFGRAVSKIAKAALGAENSISWEKAADIQILIKELKRQGFKIISIEQSPRAVDYKKISVSSGIAFILGNEVTGLPEEVLSASDIIAEIPMHGKKESLNVAVAGGIALFRILET